jgi:hypothetical protein
VKISEAIQFSALRSLHGHPARDELTLVILEKTIPRCESAAPFLCRILDHCFDVMSAQRGQSESKDHLKTTQRTLL